MILVFFDHQSKAKVLVLLEPFWQGSLHNTNTDFAGLGLMRLNNMD